MHEPLLTYTTNEKKDQKGVEWSRKTEDSKTQHKEI